MRLLDTQGNEVCQIDPTTYEIHDARHPNASLLSRPVLEGSFQYPYPTSGVGSGPFLLEMDNGETTSIEITQAKNGVVAFVPR
jgi:hypothetical protein